MDKFLDDRNAAYDTLAKRFLARKSILDDTLDIKGKHTESNSPLEGLVTFDIIFDAIAPSNGEPIKLIINIEPQKTTNSIDYKLVKRAVYYVARLIFS